MRCSCLDAAVSSSHTPVLNGNPRDGIADCKRDPAPAAQKRCTRAHHEFLMAARSSSAAVRPQRSAAPSTVCTIKLSSPTCRSPSLRTVSCSRTSPLWVMRTVWTSASGVAASARRSAFISRWARRRDDIGWRALGSSGKHRSPKSVPCTVGSARWTSELTFSSSPQDPRAKAIALVATAARIGLCMALVVQPHSGRSRRAQSRNPVRDRIATGRTIPRTAGFALDAALRVQPTREPAETVILQEKVIEAGADPVLAQCARLGFA